jgi:hypothetical protein
MSNVISRAIRIQRNLHWNLRNPKIFIEEVKIKILSFSRAWWPIPIILATWAAGIGR